MKGEDRLTTTPHIWPTIQFDKAGNRANDKVTLEIATSYNGGKMSMTIKKCSRITAARLVLSAALTCGILQADFAHAIPVGNWGSPSLITKIYSYSDYGGGDVVFKLAVSVPGCEDGFWLRPSDAGFQRNLAIIMSARFAGSPVIAEGNNNEFWPGSAGHFCRLHVISVE